MKIPNIFNTLTLKQIFWKLESSFKNLDTAFKLKALKFKMHHFQTKLSYQKAMLRQIKWWLQNGPIKKNWVLPVTNLLFSKFCFSLRTSYRDWICCTNNPNVHICTFCKRRPFSEKIKLSIPLYQYPKVLYSLTLLYTKLRAIEIY